MINTSLFIIRHSGLRLITQTEVLPTFTSEQLRLPRQDEEIITLGFDVEHDANAWTESERYLAQQATKIRELAEKKRSNRVCLFWPG